MQIIKGSEVVTPEGRGVVVDRIKDAGEWLVRLDNGTELDRAHGRWYEELRRGPDRGVPAECPGAVGERVDHGR